MSADFALALALVKSKVALSLMLITEKHSARAHGSQAGSMVTMAYYYLKHENLFSKRAGSNFHYYMELRILLSKFTDNIFQYSCENR